MIQVSNLEHILFLRLNVGTIPDSNPEYQWEAWKLNISFQGQWEASILIVLEGTTLRHRNSMTDPAQRAESVLIFYVRSYILLDG